MAALWLAVGLVAGSSTAVHAAVALLGAIFLLRQDTRLLLAPPYGAGLLLIDDLAAQTIELRGVSQMGLAVIGARTGTALALAAIGACASAAGGARGDRRAGTLGGPDRARRAGCGGGVGGDRRAGPAALRGGCRRRAGRRPGVHGSHRRLRLGMTVSAPIPTRAELRLGPLLDPRALSATLRP